MLEQNASISLSIKFNLNKFNFFSSRLARAFLYFTSTEYEHYRCLSCQSPRFEEHEDR